MHIKLLGPLLAAANASLQNQQIENLVNEGAQAIIVNPETATSLGPAITYAAAHNVQLVSVDTIVGVGHVYMVVRASNTLYGQDACAYISSKVKSGYVLDLEGDLTSSNGADRTNAFDSCMAPNDPGVKMLKDPTVWTDPPPSPTRRTPSTPTAAAQGDLLAVVQPGHRHPAAAQEKGYGPGRANHVIVVSDDGVAFEMCDMPAGRSTPRSPSRPTRTRKYALQYAVDAAKGVKLSAGQPGGGAPTLQNVTYNGDTNLADPIVAPFVTEPRPPCPSPHPSTACPARSPRPR